MRKETPTPAGVSLARDHARETRTPADGIAQSRGARWLVVPVAFALGEDRPRLLVGLGKPAGFEAMLAQPVAPERLPISRLNLGYTIGGFKALRLAYGAGARARAIGDNDRRFTGVFHEHF